MTDFDAAKSATDVRDGRFPGEIARSRAGEGVISAPEAELVSVIVPAFNAAAHIREAIASALAQTHRNLEVIVVDDGSSDATPAIVEEHAAADARVRLLRQPNRGVAAARNHGIEAARGNLIALLDADDVWHPEKIAKQVAVMRQGGPDLAVVYCRYRDIDETGRILSSPVYPPYEGDVYAALVLFNFAGGGSAALIRRACLEVVGGFDCRMRTSEDTKLLLALAERYDFALVPEFLMAYRRTASGISRDARQMMRSSELVLAEARLRHPELPARLFRWARGECSSWLAWECLSSGRFALGFELLVRTLLHDPAAAFRPRHLQALRHGSWTVLQVALRSSGGRRMLQRVGLRLRRRTSPVGDPLVGQPFLTVAPGMGAAERLARGVERLRFEERRQAVVASWRIHRSPSGSGGACPGPL